MSTLRPAILENLPIEQLWRKDKDKDNQVKVTKNLQLLSLFAGLNQRKFFGWWVGLVWFGLFLLWTELQKTSMSTQNQKSECKSTMADNKRGLPCVCPAKCNLEQCSGAPLPPWLLKVGKSNFGSRAGCLFLIPSIISPYYPLSSQPASFSHHRATSVQIK